MTGEKEPVVFRGNRWRSMLFATIGGMLYFALLAVFHFVFHERAPIDFLELVLSSLVGFMIVFYLMYRSQRFCLLVSSTTVEGPVQWPPFKRKVVPLNEIHIDESRLPKRWVEGYLQLSDGGKIRLFLFYFGVREARKILEEIARRQKDMADANLS